MILNKIFLSFAFLLIAIPVFPQLKYQLGAEAGFFSAEENQLISNSDYTARLDGQLKYISEGETNSASVSIRVRPEFYGPDNSLTTLKLKAEGNYYKRDESVTWGFNLTGQKNIYDGENINFKYNIFTFTGDAVWNVTDNIPVSTTAGYAFQKIDTENSENIDLAFLDAKVYQDIYSNLKLGYGFYMEGFSTKNNFSLPPYDAAGSEIIQINNNKGWRWGPQVSLSYLENAIISVEYRFLFHHSDLTSGNSYEQSIRLVAGKILYEELSAFLLIDYYSRHFTIKENIIEEFAPLYIPLNLENRIYLKVGYDITETAGIYIKGGYSKENLFNDKYSFSGWNALFGIEVMN